MEEVYKDIIGYEGVYKVSNFGNVISCKFGRMKLLHQQISTSGYYMVHLRYNGSNKNAQVHRLVAKMFIPNPSNLPCVNHKDENRLNNFVTNLEWCTNQYNSTYGNAIFNRVKKIDFAKIGLTTKAKLSHSVIQKTKDKRVIKIWDSINDIYKHLGYNRKCISYCCQKRKSYNTAYGYIWEYKNTTCGKLKE